SFVAHDCHCASGAVGPHHFDGTSRSAIGTSRSTSGGGQLSTHRFPSKAANGTMMPSRRSTPTPNAPGFAPAATRLAASASTEASVDRPALLNFTAAEYTPRPPEERR